MNTFISLVKKELLEINRSKKLLILGILFLFIAVSSPIIAKLIPTLLKSMPATPGLTITFPDPTWQDAVDQFIKNISQIAMIVIIFMFGGAIAEEKNKKTLEIILSKPISRKSFILAKFCANMAITKIIFIISAITFYLYTVSLFGTLNLINFTWLSILVLIYLLLIEALVIFFSSISGSQIMAVAMAFLTQIIFGTAINYIKTASDYSPAYVLSNYKVLMNNGISTDFLPSALVALAMIFILIISAMILFQKQEVER